MQRTFQKYLINQYFKNILNAQNGDIWGKKKIKEEKEIQATVEKHESKKNESLFPTRGNIYIFIDFQIGPDLSDQGQSQVTYTPLPSV